MAPAWMVRSGQQQRLIESLMREFFKTEDGFEKTRVDFAKTVLAQILLEFSVLKAITVDDSEAKFFWEATRESIRKFSRDNTEYVALAWEFFIELSKSLQNQARSKLACLELTDPQKIFHAPSAMSEVGLGDDD